MVSFDSGQYILSRLLMGTFNPSIVITSFEEVDFLMLTSVFFGSIGILGISLLIRFKTGFLNNPFFVSSENIISHSNIGCVQCGILPFNGILFSNTFSFTSYLERSNCNSLRLLSVKPVPQLPIYFNLSC